MTDQAVFRTRFRPVPMAAALALFWSGNTLTGASEPELDLLEAEQNLIAPATSPEEQRAAMLAATAEAYATLEAR